MTIDYQGTPIYTQVDGQGKPLVLLHGFLENHKIWDKFIPRLKETRQIIRIDLLGHGQTPPKGPVQTMEEQARMVATVLDALRIKSAAFIGHSMGGYITMAMAELYPERVNQLMLLNSSPFKDSEKRLKERLQAIRVVQKHKKVFVKSAITNLFAEDNRAQFKVKLDGMIEEAMQIETASIVASLEGMRQRKDRTAVLKHFSRHKWIIAGKDDGLIPFADLQNTATETQTKFVGLPGGHLSYLEQYDAVIKQVEVFLNLEE